MNNSIYSPLLSLSLSLSPPVGKTTAGLTGRGCNWIFREPRLTNYFWQGIITKRRGMPVSTLIHYFEVCTPGWRVPYSRAIVFHSIIGLSARCLSPLTGTEKKRRGKADREERTSLSRMEYRGNPVVVVASFLDRRSVSFIAIHF